ncbi:hypothetical protein [Pseudomonas poae]|uniref:hypothetical protein n=1 Tax=Pseudomonas poae TaxID=200451 RepID=UPI0007146FEA|nr:hypothetical protein [Pseudomonas poae]KRP50944.1 hypothetical protein TU75_12160 [Pseudomonas poae]
MPTPIAEKLLTIWASSKNPNSEKNKFFAVDGHFYTVAYVGNLADAERVNRLTCFAQSPDAMMLQYNAVPVAFWGVVNWQYRTLIMDTLHSLHGGDHAAVKARRTELERLVRDSYLQNKPDWQTGFLIHSLGDSYAHVKGDFDTSTAYGPIAGHGFAFKHDPDDIYRDKNYEKYNAYTLALYRALSTSEKGLEEQTGYQTLKLFTAGLTSVMESNKDHPENLTAQLKILTPNSVRIDDCEEMQSEIHADEVKVFLKNLAIDLQKSNSDPSVVTAQK